MSLHRLDRRARWRLPAALVLVVAVVVAVVAALLAVRTTPQPDAPATSVPTATATGVPAADRPAGTGPPTYLWAPSIDLSVPLGRLGLNADRTVAVPKDPDDAGWYDLGTVPGQRGSAVVLGHVDSEAGPAVFARIDELHRGDRVSVQSSDGRRLRFAVTSVTTYPNAEFPAKQVYDPGGSARRLTLITCGGGYDDDIGYLGNVVVTAELVTP